MHDTKTSTRSAAQLHLSFPHDATEDFTLPEYMPPIRRVLSVELRPLPESRFLSGAAIEIGGTAAASVLYMGEGGEITAASLTLPYNASAALGGDGIRDAASVGVDTLCESVSCRVTGPRRLTLRCRLRTHLLSLVPEECTERVTEAGGGHLTAADEFALERLTRVAPDTVLSRGETSGTVGGTVLIPEGATCIRCAGAVRVEEARACSAAVSVSGEVLLQILCLTAEGEFRTVTAKAPLAESIPIPAAAEGDMARAWGRAASVTVRDAVAGEAPWEIEYDLEAESVRVADVPYTADAFSTACASSVETVERESLAPLRCGVSSLTVSGEGGRQSKAVAGERVIAASASAAADHVEISGGTVVVHGVATVSVQIAAEGDVACEEFTVPIRCEAPCVGDASEAELIWRCAMEMCSVSARPEGERIAVTMEICVSTLVLARRVVHAVSTVTLDRALPHARRSAIRITYPEAGESVWDVAKRCAVAPRALRTRAGLASDAESLDGNAMLV